MEIVLIQSAETDWFRLLSRFGDGFDRFFNEAVDQLKKNPKQGPSYRIEPIRRMVIQKSPWGIFYVPEPTRIVILAIEDLRQDPASLKRKLEGLQP
ncbi:MAG: type II toxin-antitoxin system RelE/ParE family toxin [Verrucomicrobiota bacterium]